MSKNVLFLTDRLNLTLEIHIPLRSSKGKEDATLKLSVW